MTKPRCVLCGDEFLVARCHSGEYFVKHICIVNGEHIFTSDHVIQTYNMSTEAAAIAAIPERFVMKDSKREGEDE